MIYPSATDMFCCTCVEKRIEKHLKVIRNATLRCEEVIAAATQMCAFHCYDNRGQLCPIWELFSLQSESCGRKTGDKREIENPTNYTTICNVYVCMCMCMTVLCFCWAYGKYGKRAVVHEGNSTWITRGQRWEKVSAQEGGVNLC